MALGGNIVNSNVSWKILHWQLAELKFKFCKILVMATDQESCAMIYKVIQFSAGHTWRSLCPYTLQ